MPSRESLFPTIYSQQLIRWLVTYSRKNTKSSLQLATSSSNAGYSEKPTTPVMSNIITQRWLLNRRHFLRGLGATVALPLLDAMIPLRARAAAAAGKPPRSVFVYIPNGVNGMTWQITKPGRDFDLSPSLQPLAKHRDDFTVFSGLHHPNGLGQAHVCADTWLTGAKIDAQSARKYENTVSRDQPTAPVTER